MPLRVVGTWRPLTATRVAGLTAGGLGNTSASMSSASVATRTSTSAGSDDKGRPSARRQRELARRRVKTAAASSGISKRDYLKMKSVRSSTLLLYRRGVDDIIVWALARGMQLLGVSLAKLDDLLSEYFTESTWKGVGLVREGTPSSA